jgi:low affinity Fe/Cu permease
MESEPTRTENSGVETTVIMTALQNVCDRIDRVEGKLDQIIDQRRDEAKEAGALEARVGANEREIEQLKEEREGARREATVTRRAAYLAVFGILGQLIVLFFRK